MTMSEKSKMLAGALYRPNDPEIRADQVEAALWMSRYNTLLGRPAAERRKFLVERFAAVGDDVDIRPPFHCDFGSNIHVGSNVFLNFNCVILDTAAVVIEDGAQIGPGVQIYAADHPRDPAQRREGLEFSRPVRIGRNVWIGGGAIILPGVSIGEDAIVAAGSVVTRDVASGATVMGNPARPRQPV